MERNTKCLYETKIDAVQRCLSGESTCRYEAKELGVTEGAVRDWINRYKSMGNEGLMAQSKNTSYSSYTKTSAVKDYINGEGSLSYICRKYKIRSSTQLRRWIKKYNGYKELKTSGVGGMEIMTNGRKTTYSERIEIVKYCIEEQNNYTITAAKFCVSYQQVYTWMKKYETSGIDGLLDRRGRIKPKEEMNELDRLRAENHLLKAENTRQKMEVLFIKKLEEIERRKT